jgi:L-malate glycosyltransferase
MRPPTVVCLIDELNEWNGSEVHLFRLLQAIDPSRIRGVAATIGPSGLQDDYLRAGIGFYSLEIYRALHVSGLVGIGKIRALLAREQADLLVTYHTASDLLGPLAARLAGVPVLSSRRDDGFTKKPIHRRVQRLLNPLLEGMLSVSHTVARAVEEKEGYPRSRNLVIWNGEDLERFSPGSSRLRAELGLPAGATVVVSVAAFTPVKDHETQIAAFSRLLREHPDVDLRLVMVGLGPEEERIHALAAPLGDRVRFTGHRGDIPEVLRGSDLFLQTSLTEGFSNSILQAMAVGLPVVATRVGGNPELVHEGCGLLVPPRDPDAVAAALASLVAAPERRREMGEAARRWTLANCTIRVMAERYAEAFERAIARRFPGPPFA